MDIFSSNLRMRGGRVGLVRKGEVEDENAYARHDGNHEDQHKGDEPANASRSLFVGWGDAEEVDKGVREGEERAHRDWMFWVGGRIGYFVHPRG